MGDLNAAQKTFSHSPHIRIRSGFSMPSAIIRLSGSTLQIPSFKRVISYRFLVNSRYYKKSTIPSLFSFDRIIFDIVNSL